MDDKNNIMSDDNKNSLTNDEVNSNKKLDTKTKKEFEDKTLEKNISNKLENSKEELNKSKIDIPETSSNKKSIVNEKPIQEEIAAKPKKDIPIEKKPFDEFIKNHLLPSMKTEFEKIGYVVNKMNFEYTVRPVAGDKCWVIQCEIKNTFNFWLAFEKEDITSLKSFTLSKVNQSPSVLESFLIDEKKITLKLIISRIFQRLNGQKLLGAN